MPEGDHAQEAGRPLYHRVLLKLSGDAFAPIDTGYGISTTSTGLLARELADVVDLGVQCAVVVGGGNIFRGRQAPGIDRSRADYMGMLATVMNALALQDALEKIHVPTRVQTAIHMAQIAEPYIPLRAIRHLEKGRVVVFAAGIGAPYFSTDTTAAQRALEIGAQAILKGTKVDGIYTADPHVDPDGAAVRDDRVPRRAPRGVPGHGRHGDQPLHGERPADHRVRLRVRGEHQPGRVGRTDRHLGPRGRPMTVDSALKAAVEKMDKAISVLKDELAGVRTGRATPALLQRVVVDYYGTPVPIQQLASFSVPEPRTLMISPFDRNAIAAMEKSIMSSDLGITPSNDGTVIRLSFPPLTEERRKELIKLVHHRGEEGRVAVRNIRRHSKEELEKLEREGGISEDDLVRSEKELQKLTDKHISDIDDVVAHKDAELKEI